MAGKNARIIALGSRLQGVPEVLTVGVKPNFLDYTAVERKLIMDADIILYPTLNYAQFFTTMGKRIFPSLETYLYSDEKIKQTTLFLMLSIPHPRTRIYYHLHHQDIQGNSISRSLANWRGLPPEGEEYSRFMIRWNSQHTSNEPTLPTSKSFCLTIEICGSYLLTTDPFWPTGGFAHLGISERIYLRAERSASMIFPRKAYAWHRNPQESASSMMWAWISFSMRANGT